MSDKSKPDILFLYCEEEEGVDGWVTYVKSCCDEVKKDLTIQIVDLDTRLKDIASLCSEAYVVCLVASSGALDTIEQHVDILTRCLDKHCVSVIELFLEPGDFTSRVTPQCPVDKFKCYEIGENQNYRQVASDIVETVSKAKSKKSSGQEVGTCNAFTAELENKLKKQHSGERTSPRAEEALSAPEDQERSGTPEADTNESAKPERNTSKTRGSILKEICPNCIRQVDERLVLIFDREIKESVTVQVKIGDKMIDTQRLNPYNYAFNAPAHREGPFDAYVYFDGKKASHREGPFDAYVYFDGKKACKRHLRYMSPSSMAYTCPQYLMDVLGLADLKALDDELTRIFNESVPGDVALKHILTPKNIAATAGEGAKSIDKLPTLLHFACHYGLQHLCTSITDTPGTDYALQVRNVEDKTPMDLAQEGGFEDIVSFLEDFQDMTDYMTDLEMLYEKMGGTKEKLSAGYIDMTKGYMEMGGGEHVPEANYDYGQGRLAMVEENYETSAGLAHEEDDYITTLPEDPYEIKLDSRGGGVQEVDASEDKHDPTTDDVAANGFTSRPVDIPPKVPPKSKALSPTPVTDPFKEVIPMPKAAMGSSSLNELVDMQESFKNEELSLDAIETLYRAWQQRNQNCPSHSIKEKQKKLTEMKAVMQNVEQNVDKKKPGFFSRFTNKKTTQQQISALNIQHNVHPENAYTSMPRSNPPSRPLSNRDSTASTSSTSSFSSSGSRASNFDFSIDEEPEPTTPVRPPRPNVAEATPIPPPRPPNTLSPKSKPASRLPKPPASYSRQPPTSVPRVPPRNY